MAKIAFQLWSFTVRGKRDFPVDMLRYDRCWPASTSAAFEIGSTRDISTFNDEREVQMIGCGEPTHLRWQSFGWAVTTYQRYS